MNYLAHIYLSGSNIEQQIGGFIGDFVKGDFSNKFTKDIEDGIKLHRKIDRIADHLDPFIQSKKRVREHLSRFSGIFVDIYYDHFLAKNWNDFNNTSLIEFSHDFINQLSLYSDYVPDKALLFTNYMKHNQLFDYYCKTQNIEK